MVSSIFRLSSIVVAIALLFGCGGTVKEGATFGAYSFPSGKGGQVIDPSFTATEGDMFQITGSKTVVVTALGVEHADPTQTDRQVAIVDTSGNILATTVISTSDNLVEGYHYKSITPISLTPGKQYFVGELHIAGTQDFYIWNTNVASTPSYIQDIGTCYGGLIQTGMGFSTPGTPRHYSASFLSHQIGI